MNSEIESEILLIWVNQQLALLNTAENRNWSPFHKGSIPLPAPYSFRALLFPASMNINQEG